MNDLYTEEFKKLTLQTTEDNLQDLLKWSVYNGDKLHDEIDALLTHFRQVKALLTQNV